MEYTLASAVSVVVTIVLDRVLGTQLLRDRRFWVFLAVMAGFKLLVNGYLTWRPIVLYGPDHFMGIRLFTIPLEDFMFGFSLVGLSVLLWEYFKRRETAR